MEQQKPPKCTAARPSKIIFPPVDIAADGDKQSLQTRKSESAQANMNEPNRHTDSKELTRHLATRGRHRERSRVRSEVKQKHESLTERLKTSKTQRDMATVSHCGSTKVKSAEAVSKEMAEEVIDGRSEHRREFIVSKNAATPQLARLALSQCSEIEPTVSPLTPFSSVNPLRKAFQKGEKKKMQRAVAPDGSDQLQTLPNVTKGKRSKSTSGKDIRQPWR